MARIRAIKPEFWSSPSLPADPWARLLFIAMWNWADDNGIGTANPRELLGFAFPNDDHIGPADIRRMLGGIRRDFGVMFYTVGGRPYYSIPSWRQHQKFDNRAKGKYPGPDEAETWLYQGECDESADTRRDPPGTRRDVVAGTGEQGNRGTGEQEPPNPPRLETTGAVAVIETPGAKKRRAIVDAINDTARPAAVFTLMHDYEQASVTPIAPKMRAQIEDAITPLMAQGIPAEQIAEGIRLWEASDSFSPTQIGNYVHKAGAKASKPAGVGKPTAKAMGYLDIGDQLIEGMTS